MICWQRVIEQLIYMYASCRNLQLKNSSTVPQNPSLYGESLNASLRVGYQVITFFPSYFILT